MIGIQGATGPLYRAHVKLPRYRVKITHVGLTGYAGAGKDAAAEALVADGWRRDAFADRMRAGLLALDPWVDQAGCPLSDLVAACGWDMAKRSYSDVRGLLQRFGTEAGRAIHGEDVWVDALFRTIELGQRVVITDVRFDNEAEAIAGWYGIVIEIRRPGCGPVNGHASDAGISPDLIDFVVVNDGTVADLHAKIREVVGSA